MKIDSFFIMISLLSACGQNSEITRDNYPIENINQDNQSHNITYEDKALEEEPLYRERIQHKPRKAFFQKAALITGGISTILAIILVGRLIEGDISLETEIKKPLFFKHIEVETPKHEPLKSERVDSDIDQMTKLRRSYIQYEFSRYPFKNQEDVANIMIKILLSCVKTGIGTPEQVLEDLNEIELKWDSIIHKFRSFFKDIRYKSLDELKDTFSSGGSHYVQGSVDIKDLIRELLKEEEGFQDLIHSKI